MDRKKKKTKHKKWCRPRHRVFRALAFLVLRPYMALRYRFHCKVYPEKRPMLVLFNHETSFDQFFVGCCFHQPVYYVASEDLFSNGLTSAILRYAVAPIPMKKSTTDVRAVLNCMQVAKEGGTIALAPEGNRTYHGRLTHIKPSVVSLVRALRLPVAFVRIEGGFGVEPRWAHRLRGGSVTAGVHSVLEPEAYAAMSDDELYAHILDALNVDETKTEGNHPGRGIAEYLERVMYVCPTDGFSSFEAHGDVIRCEKCGKRVRYLPNKTLEGIDGAFPFASIADWYEYQVRFVVKTDLSSLPKTALYSDEVSLTEVILYKKKIKLDKHARLSLFRDRIEITAKGENTVMPFTAIDVTSVLGRNKLNIYFGKKLWQIKGGVRFNALKYMNLCYHAQNVEKGDPENEFLGL